jgi:hypothetical protein
MYNGTNAALAATGASFSLASLIWWPLAAFALLAAGIALLRIAKKRRQIEP